MLKKFDLLVFDWDGTLMDSAAAIVSSIQSACRDMNLPVPDAAKASHIIGLGLNEAIAALQPQLAIVDYPRFISHYRRHFLSHDQKMPLFDEVAAAIHTLNSAGFLLAIATGKGRNGLDRVLQSTALAPYFHTTRCADECHSKPHPAMLLEIMETLGVSPEKTLMIGDTSHDLQMAANAGVSCVAACYGAHPREHLLSFTSLAYLDDFPTLYRWLQQHA